MASKNEPLTSNAPEGGWGWYIALAFALNNVSIFHYTFKNRITIFLANKA